MSTLKPLTDSLLPSEAQDVSRGNDYVIKMFGKYNIRSYAVLVAPYNTDRRFTRFRGV